MLKSIKEAFVFSDKIVNIEAKIRLYEKLRSLD
jgi:hypothetical protein